MTTPATLRSDRAHPLQRRTTQKLSLQPLTFAEACLFIQRHHRHHRPPQGWKFGVAVNDEVRIVGVATIGRPVARHLDNGWTLEVTRCCTDGTGHVASMLYSAARRAAKALGYRRLITYTLAHEKGVSLKAAGWRVLYQTAGGSWHRKTRPRTDKNKTLTLPKRLWEAAL